MVRRLIASLPGIGAALLPSVTCPACLPVYAGVLSSLGLGAIVSGPYYIATVCLLLGVSILSLGYRARSRRGYLPLLLGICASIALLLNKSLIGPRAIDYVAAVLLLAASIWNNWPRKQAKSGNNCQHKESGKCCD